jgi:succinate dehydrogenase / fumarate reductase cytochrome b subunit
MKTKRPVHLDLPKIKLPIGGITSILHRVTGVYLFLALPVLLYLLDQSLQSAAGYVAASDTLHSFWGVLLLFGLMWSLLHHLLAGIRYLLIDVHWGVEKTVAQQTAWGVLVAAPVLAIVLTWGVL